MRICLCVLLACLPVAVWELPGSRAGWRFELLRPPTIRTSASFDEFRSETGVRRARLGAFGDPAILPPGPGIVGAALAPPLAVPAAIYPATPACTMEDVCRKLDAILMRMGPLPPAMPPGKNGP